MHPRLNVSMEIVDGLDGESTVEQENVEFTLHAETGGDVTNRDHG